MFDNVTSSFEPGRAGKIRALGVTMKEGSETMPGVPPISDILAGYETSPFYGVGAPRASGNPDLRACRGSQGSKIHMPVDIFI